MTSMSCPASGCRSGYIHQMSGGTMMTIPCAVCGGTGRVERKERVVQRNPWDCPYDACGGVCQGRGYYDYYGHTIWCNAGRASR